MPGPYPTPRGDATLALFERELPLTPRAYVGAAITLGGLGVSLLRR
jgi:hypothetical protein